MLQANGPAFTRSIHSKGTVNPKERAFVVGMAGHYLPWRRAIRIVHKGTGTYFVGKAGADRRKYVWSHLRDLKPPEGTRGSSDVCE